MILLYFLILCFSNGIYLYSYDRSTISINNKSYRESLKSNYFVFDKKYNLDKPYKYNVKKINTIKTFLGTNLNNDYLIKTPVKIGNINYFYHRPHVFNYIINLVSHNLVHINLIHNNNTIYKNYNDVLSIFNKINLKKGYHNFDLILYNNDYSCNCPSMKKGYSNTRFFFGFITQDEEYSISYPSSNLLVHLKL